MPTVDLTPYYQPQGSTSDGSKFDNLLALLQTTLNGLDNNNVATAAAIAASKIAGIATVITTVNLGSANTDLASPGSARHAFWTASVGAGTLRTIGAPTENGSRVALRNGSGSSITLKHQLAGGTGAQLFLRTAADVTLLDKEIVEFAYDGTTWYEVGRDQAVTASNGPGTELDYAQITATTGAISATTEGTAVAVITGNSKTYDGTKVKAEVCVPGGITGTLTATFVLLRDSTVIGQSKISNTGSSVEVYFAAFDTPTAAAHTYSVSVFVNTSSTTVVAGAGGSGNILPAFLRVTKA